MKAVEGICEMCGHYVAVRQKAHIVAEQKSNKENVLLLCPSCHIVFDTRLKPKLYQALVKAGVHDLPDSWRTSIYDQAAEASMKIGANKKR